MKRSYFYILGVYFSTVSFVTLLFASALPDLSGMLGLGPSASGLLGTALMVGIGAGSIIFGILSDIAGRRITLIISLLIFSIFSGITGLFRDYNVIGLLLFVTGTGLGGGISVAISMLSDILEDKERAVKTCIFESFWGIGAMVSILLLRFHLGYSNLFFSGIASLVILPLLRNLPEGKHERKKSGFRDLLKTYRRKTARFWAIWFCSIYTYFGVFLWLPKVSILYYSARDILPVIYGMQILSPLMLSFIVKRSRREVLLASYNLIAFLTLLPFLIFPERWFYPAMLMVSFFSIGGWAILILYTPESFPPSIRGAAVGSSAGVGRVGGILAPALTGRLMEYGSITAPFIVFSAMFLAIPAILFFTSGEETPS